MDNAYKAIVMAGSVLLFLIAISVSIYYYTRILAINSRILTNSEYYDRTAERFQFTDYYTTTDGLNTQNLEKIYNGDQVIWSILNMYSVKVEEREVATIDLAGTGTTTQTFTTQDLAYDEITVQFNGHEYVFKRSDYKLYDSTVVGNLALFNNNRFKIKELNFSYITENGKTKEVRKATFIKI